MQSRWTQYAQKCVKSVNLEGGVRVPFEDSVITVKLPTTQDRVEKKEETGRVFKKEQNILVEDLRITLRLQAQDTAVHCILMQIVKKKGECWFNKKIGAIKDINMNIIAVRGNHLKYW